MKNNGLDPVTHKPLTHAKSHDFEPKNEETEHHRRHHHHHQEMETVSIPTLKDYDQMQQQQQHKREEGSPSNQETITNDSNYIKNLDMGSSLLFQNKDSLGNFSVDSNYHNNLIDNPFFWDCFTGLGDNFP